MAQSELQVALVGLGGVATGAVATLLAARYTSLGGVRAATIAQLDTFQSEFAKIVGPYAEARIQLDPVRDGRTPEEWRLLAPTLPRTAPGWCSMAPNHQLLYERPVIVRRDAAWVDGAVRRHQALGAPSLDDETRDASRRLHRDIGELVNDLSNLFKRLAKRGMGVM
ncbi:hypothetical protein ACFWZ2_01415 [Streptomyces sp. NPDC059002]|uniref:hypothetical protein n=1 Tax=Streptomyces sp. NPDC059002 TaxID=3346690 RepID=UPI0036B14021